MLDFMSLQDQFNNGMLSGLNGVHGLREKVSLKDIFQQAKQNNLLNLARKGVPGILPEEPKPMQPINAGGVDATNRLSGQLYELVANTRDENTFQQKYQALLPQLLQQYPGMNFPQNATREQIAQIANQAAAENKAYWDAHPTKSYDPNPPPMPGQQGASDKIGLLKELIGADKGGNLKGILPLLLKDAGILGGGGSANQFAGNPEAAIGVTQPDRASMMGMNPLQAYMQGVNPDTGLTYGAYDEDSLKRVKGMLDINNLMNPKIEPKVLNPGQVMLDEKGNIIAAIPDMPNSEFGQPVASLDENGQPVYIVTDKQGNTKKLPFMPIPQKGMQITSDGQGGFSLSQGGTALPGNIPLTTGTMGDVQNKWLSINDMKMKYQDAMQNYNKSFLTYPGQLRGKYGEVKEKLTGKQTDQEFLGQQTRFIQATEQIFNIYRKEITGAAAALAELERLRKTMMNTDQSPSQFEAASAQFNEFTNKLEYAYRNVLSKGIPEGSPEFGQALDAEMYGFGAGYTPQGMVGPQRGQQNDPWGWR